MSFCKDIKNNQILVSVIMCVYNTKIEYLLEAVNSILNQTHSNFELIIIDDCSNIDLFTDPVFLDKKIKILRNNINKGPAYSRNKGLDVAKGKYIAVMDSDDISRPLRLERQVAFLENNPNVFALGTWFSFFGDKNHEVKRVIDDNDYYRCCLLFGNIPTLLNPSVMIRKDALDSHCIRWNESLRISEDYLMWVQLAECGVVTKYKEVLLDYRSHINQSTSKVNKKRLNSNSWIVKQYQLNKLGINATKKDTDLISCSKAKSLKQLRQINAFVDKIITANNHIKYYEPTKFEIRCNEYIYSLIQKATNPFLFLILFFSKKYRVAAFSAFKRKSKKILLLGKRNRLKE